MYKRVVDLILSLEFLCCLIALQAWSFYVLMSYINFDKIMNIDNLLFISLPWKVYPLFLLGMTLAACILLRIRRYNLALLIGSLPFLLTMYIYIFKSQRNNFWFPNCSELGMRGMDFYDTFVGLSMGFIKQCLSYL